MVGADLEDSNATGANGDASDNSALGSGAAYVFVRSGTTWTQQAYLKASNTQGGAPFGDRFGYSVSLSDDTAVISALDEDSDATGVNGNQLDNNFSSSGAAYVFVRSGTSWAQQAYLKASNTGFDAAFGISTSISGDTLVIGAEREDNSAAGVNGNQTAGFLNNSGAAYVFVRSGSTWIQQAYLKASSSGAGDQFGRAVAISGDRLAVGAPFEDSIATGVDGDQSDNSFSSAGATYVFERSASTWSQLAYLKASNTGPGDNFGRALALSGGTLIVSSYLEDSSATGVDGDQSDNSVSNSGAAYVFDLGGDPWVDLGSAMAGTHGDPLLEGSGSLMVGDTVTLSLSNALESSTTFFVIGLAEVNLPFYGGTLVPSFEAPLGLFIALPTDGAGELVLSDTWPTGIPSGTDLFFQHWIVDGGAAFGFAGSNAVKGTTP